ncbi:hypothetical protein [Hoylesella enoeca]|uniref:hypothetical protein n=1 Tax=Hoylesella enoeca TaxID=76123 RepID=UPI00288BDA4C|nr:hypothetical protein [Hoylesella enoeca]
MKKYIFLSAALLLLTASCSTNDDNNNEQREETQGVRFTINEEGFGADTELTRSEVTAQPQIIDVGDCEAEISIENAPAEKQAATRGVTTPVHYTIRAYLSSGVLKDEIKGTFTPTGFTPDAGYNAYMLLGRNHTYTFICFNDKVTPNGNNLDVTLANAKDARIGRQQIAIGTADQTINLSSKHAGCRIQTKILCKKDMPTAITATFASRGANVPQTVSYNPSTNTYTATNGSFAPEANNSPASTEAKYTASNYGQNYSYTSTSTDYHYVLPTTDAKNLQLNFTGGTIFWKPLNSSMPGLSTASTSLVANGSYTINIKMKPNFTYLMSDGTLGHLKDTTFGGAPAATAKTPIAVVLDAGLHMAIALKDAMGKADLDWCDSKYSFTKTNTHNVDYLGKAINSEATSGYDETWDATYTTSAVTGNKVKALNPDFPAFKAAAEYNPGTAYTGSPALKWYLPSYNDFKWLYATLGFGDKTAVTQIYTGYDWYYFLLYDAFTQVGGTKMLGGSSKSYWTSSEGDNMPAFYMIPPQAGWGNSGKGVKLPVRPFVKY